MIYALQLNQNSLWNEMKLHSQTTKQELKSRAFEELYLVVVVVSRGMKVV